MELKKSPKADLQNKKSIFFQIGLIGALLFVICIFGWSKSEVEITSMESTQPIIEDEIIEITREQPIPDKVTPKQALQVTSDIINIVKDDKKIETEFTFVDPTEGLEVIFSGTPGGGGDESGIDDDIPFSFLEDMPMFQGGDVVTFRTWVQKQVRYPSIAQENGIQGRVLITFVIERNGTLSNIEAMASPDKSLSDEAIRIIRTSPKWTPGKQRGQPVRFKYTLPIDFTLN